MSADDTIHGHRIVAQFTTAGSAMTRPGRLILVDRGPETVDRWVSSWQGQGDSEWTQGHYFGDWLDARAHFLAACAREHQ